MTQTEKDLGRGLANVANILNSTAELQLALADFVFKSATNISESERQMVTQKIQFAREQLAALPAIVQEFRLLFGQG